MRASGGRGRCRGSYGAPRAGGRGRPGAERPVPPCRLSPPAEPAPAWGQAAPDQFTPKRGSAADKGLGRSPPEGLLAELPDDLVARLAEQPDDLGQAVAVEQLRR